MRRWNWLLMTTGLFLLSLVISAQGPQTNPPPSPQVNQDRIEAAHGKLLSGEDRAKDASRLTEAVAPVLPDSASSTAPVPRKNFIDEHIFGRMERDKIPHAPLAGDEEFLRRAYLDATGLLPSPDQVRSFIRDTDPNKRDKLIDSLIGTEEFTDSGHITLANCCGRVKHNFISGQSSGSRWTAPITTSLRTSSRRRRKTQRGSRRLKDSMIRSDTSRRAAGCGQIGRAHV